jgi:putative Mg2+ transporter-C (MgtC) family protein
MSTSNLTLFDVVIRLIAAYLVGGALGLNRDLHHKSAGVRTIGLVALASAMIVIAGLWVGPVGSGPGDITRIIQGILSGVGFIGAGVIVRGPSESNVHGLTTAASVWAAAGFGIIAGLGAWEVLALSVGLIFLLLVFGGPLEEWVRKIYPVRNRNDDSIGPPE